jgi:hypothetical protein
LHNDVKKVSPKKLTFFNGQKITNNNPIPMSNENNNIRPISNDDYRREIIMQRPRIIYNHMTRDSYVTLEINDIKEYILKNTVHINVRSIRKQHDSHYTSWDYFEF